MRIWKGIIFLPAFVALVGVGFFYAWGKSAPELDNMEMPSPRLFHPPGSAGQGPFTCDLSPVLAWTDNEQSFPFRIEISLDEKHQQPVFRAMGESSCINIPEHVLIDGQRYFMRLSLRDEAGDWSEWTEPDWFVIDSRYIGFSAVSPHHYPFGKTAGRNLIRDGRDRLHMVFAALAGDRRRIYYGWSENDGYDWEFLRIPQQSECRKAVNPALALSPDHETLHLAWGEYERFPGYLVYCSLDISGDTPSILKPPEIISTRETSYCQCIMPSLAVDSRNVVHAVWQVGHFVHDCGIAYANNRNGWGNAVDLRSTAGNGVGCTLCIDSNDALHVLWEGSQYRWSDDYGKTWRPSLDEDPLIVFSELPDLNQRPRECCIRNVHGSSKVVAACVAEDIIYGQDGKPVWTGILNQHNIWVKEMDSGRLNEAQLIRKIRARTSTLTESLIDAEGIRFVRMPSVSTSEDGSIAVAWTETEVLNGRHSLKAFGMTGKPGSEWNDVFEIGANPGSASVSPFLADGFSDFIDVVWTETGQYDWRRFIGGGIDEKFDLYNVYHGILFSRFSREGYDMRGPVKYDPSAEMMDEWQTLEKFQESTDGGFIGSVCNGRRIEWRQKDAPDYSPDARDRVPDMITLPGASRSADSPTYTAVPTETPIPTATPQGTLAVISEPLADAYVDQAAPTENYGTDTYMIMEKTEQFQKMSYIKYDLSQIPCDAEIHSARLTGTVFYGLTGSLILTFPVTESWDEENITFENRPADQPITITPNMYEGGENLHLDVTETIRWILQQDPMLNHGMVVKCQNFYYPGVYIYSKDNASHAPSLYVDYSIVSPTTTPPPSPSPVTPVPTSTPATPTPALGVDLQLSQSMFHPDDLFLLTAIIYNWGPETYTAQPFVILLDVYGVFFWHPQWTVEFDYVEMDLGIETMEEEILNFTWPQEQSTGSGIKIYGALLTRDFSAILGEWDIVQFGWDHSGD